MESQPLKHKGKQKTQLFKTQTEKVNTLKHEKTSIKAQSVSAISSLTALSKELNYHNDKPVSVCICDLYNSELLVDSCNGESSNVKRRDG